MGLGPPVCRECKVIFEHNHRSPYFNSQGEFSWWRCPKCLTFVNTGWAFNLSKEEYQEYWDNTDRMKSDSSRGS